MKGLFGGDVFPTDGKGGFGFDLSIFGQAGHNRFSDQSGN